MNNQDAFDIMVVHAFKQKERAADGESCMYRLPNGMKCFVGALIPDEQYRPELEGKVAKNLIVLVPALQGLGKNFLMEAQDIHDSVLPIHWFKQFEKLANDWRLDITVLNKYEGIEL